MSNTKISVKNLLIESRIHDNLGHEIDRFKLFSNLLKEYNKHNKSLSSLIEGEDGNRNLVSELLSESATTFKKARRELSRAKSSNQVNEIHSSLSKAHNHLNSLEGQILAIEDIIEENINQLEEHEDPDMLKKKALGESSHGEEYEDIFHAQEHEATEVLDIIDRKGEKAAIEYLMQWHQPGNHMTRSTPGHGRDDKVFEHDGYILSYNPQLETVSLVYRVDNLDESLNLKYLPINHLTGDDANHGFEILERKGRKGLVNYLKQFKPTGHIRPEPDPSFSRGDNKFRLKDYIFYYNEQLGYMGVDKVISSN